MTVHLTSPKGERVKQVTALHRSKGRRSAGRFLVEGQHPVAEALADGWVEEVFCLAEEADRWASAPHVTTVDARVLRAMSDAATPQGVIAVAAVRTSSLGDVVGDGVLVVLAGAADPGNVGTIIRTADAMGASGVVLTSGSVDPFSPKVVRSTAGSITHVPLVVGVDLAEVVVACREAGQRLVGLAADAPDPVDGVGLVAPVAVVLGSEAHGLATDEAATLDQMVRIPMLGRAESLNLAVSAAITLHEAARRQRR